MSALVIAKADGLKFEPTEDEIGVRHDLRACRILNTQSNRESNMDYRGESVADCNREAKDSGDVIILPVMFSTHNRPPVMNSGPLDRRVTLGRAHPVPEMSWCRQRSWVGKWW